MAEDPLNTLVAILRDRDLPYNRDALKSAYDDPENQTAIREWIQEYFSPETLLTKDEVNLRDVLPIWYVTYWQTPDMQHYRRPGRRTLSLRKISPLFKASMNKRYKLPSKNSNDQQQPLRSRARPCDYSRMLWMHWSRTTKKLYRHGLIQRMLRSGNGMWRKGTLILPWVYPMINIYTGSYES